MLQAHLFRLEYQRVDGPRIAPDRLEPHTRLDGVSGSVRLRHAEAGEAETAAIVKVELLILLDHSVGVERSAEIEPSLRNAADDPRFGRQRHVFEDALLGCDCRDAFRDADTEIDHASKR